MTRTHSKKQRKYASVKDDEIETEKGEHINRKSLMKAVAATLLAAVVAPVLTRCATITKRSHKTVDFTSNPADAEVYVNGVLQGNTPINRKLESKRSYIVEFRKQDLATRTYTLTSYVGIGYVILGVLLGLVPVIVGAATGSWYDLDQESLNAVLEKEQ